LGSREHPPKCSACPTAGVVRREARARIADLLGGAVATCKLLADVASAGMEVGSRAVRGGGIGPSTTDPVPPLRCGRQSSRRWVPGLGTQAQTRERHRRLMVEVDAFAADGVSSVRVSI
jgi:hypothetical protein